MQSVTYDVVYSESIKVESKSLKGSYINVSVKAMSSQKHKFLIIESDYDNYHDEPGNTEAVTITVNTMKDCLLIRTAISYLDNFVESTKSIIK